MTIAEKLLTIYSAVTDMHNALTQQSVNNSNYLLNMPSQVCNINGAKEYTPATIPTTGLTTIMGKCEFIGSCLNSVKKCIINSRVTTGLTNITVYGAKIRSIINTTTAYTLCDYISVTGTSTASTTINGAAIDTGIVAKHTTRLVYDFSITTGTTPQIVCGGRDWYTYISADRKCNAFALWTEGGEFFTQWGQSGYTAYKISGFTATSNQRLVLDWNMRNVTLTVKSSGAVYYPTTNPLPSTTFTSTTPIYIGSIAYMSNAYASGSVDGRQAKQRDYSAKIYDNGTLVRNYVPVKRKSDGIFGMLDLVNKRYSKSSTAKNFGGKVGTITE